MRSKAPSIDEIREGRPRSDRTGRRRYDRGLVWVAALLIPVETSAQPSPPPSLLVSDEARCRSCRIELHPVLTIREPLDGHLEEWSRITVRGAAQLLDCEGHVVAHLPLGPESLTAFGEQ